MDASPQSEAIAIVSAMVTPAFFLLAAGALSSAALMHLSRSVDDRPPKLIGGTCCRILFRRDGAIRYRESRDPYRSLSLWNSGVAADRTLNRGRRGATRGCSAHDVRMAG